MNEDRVQILSYTFWYKMMNPKDAIFQTTSCTEKIAVIVQEGL